MSNRFRTGNAPRGYKGYNELQLNDPNLPNTYEEFEGVTCYEMQRLIASGKVPLSVADIMKRRLEVAHSHINTKVKKCWWDFSFDSGDGAARSLDGKLKIVLDAKPLRQITPDSEWLESGLILPDNMYKTFEGPEFKLDELEKYYGGMLKKEVKRNPIWQTLARDQSLLNEYADYVFAQAERKDKYNKDTYNKFMGINLVMPLYDESKTVSTIRTWSLYKLDPNSSCIGTRIRVGDYRGRLVGIEPKAQDIHEKNLEGGVSA